MSSLAYASGFGGNGGAVLQRIHNRQPTTERQRPVGPSYSKSIDPIVNKGTVGEEGDQSRGYSKSSHVQAQSVACQRSTVVDAVAGRLHTVQYKVSIERIGSHRTAVSI
jgi:hypothetical protein